MNKNEKGRTDKKIPKRHLYAIFKGLNDEKIPKRHLYAILKGLNDGVTIGSKTLVNLKKMFEKQQLIANNCNRKFNGHP